MTARSLNLLLLLPLLIMSACTSLLLPSEYVLTQERLSSKLAQKFSVSRETARGNFKVTLDAPELGFMAEQNRLSFAFHFSATTALRLGVDGRIALSSSLRYDEVQHAIYLQDVKVDALQVRQDMAGLVDRLRPQLTRMLSDHLKEKPLHRFEPEELRFKGMEIEIETVDVVSNGIRIKFKR
ncbi:MAG: DUF1439 domain-containing protein [Gallionella sp.]|nr:DUF1439 domain-containing protein [Gallionella sp.]